MRRPCTADLHRIEDHDGAGVSGSRRSGRGGGSGSGGGSGAADLHRIKDYDSTGVSGSQGVTGSREEAGREKA